MQGEAAFKIRNGIETAFIDENIVSELDYKPQFVFNNHKIGKKYYHR